MLKAYIIGAVLTGIIFERMRPKKYDDISLALKLWVPTIAGLLWPVMLVWWIVLTIKEWVT